MVRHLRHLTVWLDTSRPSRGSSSGTVLTCVDSVQAIVLTSADSVHEYGASWKAQCVSLQTSRERVPTLNTLLVLSRALVPGLLVFGSTQETGGSSGGDARSIRCVIHI